MAVRATRVDVATTATPLNASSTDYRSGSSLLIRNRGDVAVFIGGANVSTSTGFQLDPGETLPVDLDEGEIIYGRVAADTESCHVLEVGV